MRCSVAPSTRRLMLSDYTAAVPAGRRCGSSRRRLIAAVSSLANAVPALVDAGKVCSASARPGPTPEDTARPSMFRRASG
jgi:hypothetical protein